MGTAVKLAGAAMDAPAPAPTYLLVGGDGAPAMRAKAAAIRAGQLLTVGCQQTAWPWRLSS